MSEFDCYSDRYQQLLDESIALTGESGDYFARYKAKFVAERIVPRSRCRILDYGCGVGLVSRQLKDCMPEAQVDGYDPSALSLDRVETTLRSQGVFVNKTDELEGNYDIVVMANVLHHVQPRDRQDLVSKAAGLLADGGRMVIFEHNPVNPLTRFAVDRCPFDEDAILLPPRETYNYLTKSQLEGVVLDYIVFFPRALRWFRPMEQALKWCPLGAQYAAYGTRTRGNA